MKIAITKNTSNGEKFRKYESWLLRFNPLLEFQEMEYETSDPGEIEECDGLLLTGGDDVHPRFYGKGDSAAQAREINERRDQFEFNVIERVLATKMPVLGICRGLQSMNVYLGGSLHVDLEAEGFLRHTERDGRENRHRVTLEPSSILGMNTGRKEGEVNSSHHQAADIVGRGLKVSARSEDGVVEGLEWDDPSVKSFLMLMQWHPERMKDTANPLTERVGRIFLEEVQKHHRINHLATKSH